MKNIPVQQTSDTQPGLLSLKQALEKIFQSLTPIQETRQVGIKDAFNKVLAEAIQSPLNVPAYRNSAMDGYAVRSEDLPTSGELTLKQVGISWAGRPRSGSVLVGECVRIMTGAKLPDDTDTVIMQEHVRATKDAITIGTGHCATQNVRLPGEDIKQGTTVLNKGTLIKAAEMGLIASLGLAHISVYRPLRVSFFSTGDELRSIGETLQDGQIYDSNRYLIQGMLNTLDVEINDMGVIPDDRQQIEQAFLDAASQSDVVITSGGVSVGDADFVKETLEKLGSINFWKLAIKPGKPLAFGKVNNAVFIGLPGNPVSVMAIFYQVGLPTLRHLMGQQNIQPVIARARTTCKLKKRPGRQDFQRGIFSYDDNQQLVVKGVGMQASHVLSGMSQANCFIVLPTESGSVDAGEWVDIQPFEGLM